MPFSVGTSARPVALDIADVDQPLDDRRARRRRADARVLHRLAQLVIVDELAGGLHRAQQRGVGVAPRRLGLLLLDSTSRVSTVSPCSSFGSCWSRPSSSSVSVLALRQLAVDAAPAGHEEDLAARPEDVPRDRGLDARVLELGLGVEDRQEAPRDEVVDAAVVVAHLVGVVRGVRRDDRVVVGDLGVVDHAAERQHVEPGTYAAPWRTPLAPDVRGGRLDLGDHVARQVARARARIGQRLVLLVAALGRAERAARARSRSACWPRAAATSGRRAAARAPCAWSSRAW